MGGHAGEGGAQAYVGALVLRLAELLRHPIDAESYLHNPPDDAPGYPIGAAGFRIHGGEGGDADANSDQRRAAQQRAQAAPQWRDRRIASTWCTKATASSGAKRALVTWVVMALFD